MFELIERRRKLIVISYVIGLILMFGTSFISDDGMNVIILGMVIVVLTVIRYITIKIMDERNNMELPQDHKALEEIARKKSRSTAGKATIALFGTLMVFTLMVGKWYDYSRILLMAVVFYRQISLATECIIKREKMMAIYQTITGMFVLGLVCIQSIPLTYAIMLIVVLSILNMITKKINKRKEASW